MRFMQIGEGTYRNKKMKDKPFKTADLRASRYVSYANAPEKTASQKQSEANNASVSESDTSEKPIDQITPEAYRTDSTYTNMVRGQCNKTLHQSLANDFSRSG
jgi:hypothetical protein